jgi:hypothetical protein
MDLEFHNYNSTDDKVLLMFRKPALSPPNLISGAKRDSRRKKRLNSGHFSDFCPENG